MANVVWGQDNFTKGELSPMLYARTTAAQYYVGLRQAYNCQCYPQGAMGKRFGTLYRSIATNVNDTNTSYFFTFQYGNECTYQIIVRADNIDIYLEGLLVSTVASTGMTVLQVQEMDYTIFDRELIITSLKPFAPSHLLRASGAANIILSVASNTIVFTTAVTAGRVYPVRFTSSANLPTTTPQIVAGHTYFIYTTTTTAGRLYSTSKNAAYNVDPFTITNVGTGVSNVFFLNTWALTAITFKNLPVYDFAGGYNAITFTPTAVVGSTTLTASAAIFTAAHVGGAFVGGGGIARITVVTDSTHATINIMEPFTGNLAIPPVPIAIPGRIALLAEPAWSATVGYPTKCSSYQNRVIYCNSDSLPNGFWASAINDYTDFNDIAGDDDDAISWYPSSDNITYIRFIVPYRSITIHTNSGVFSSPLSFETAITPSNFSLMLQDSSAADVVQPQNIDNQIIICSGNDVHNLLWDGYNNAYSSNIISVFSEHLVRTPMDEFVFQDQHRAGSRYVFIINENGTMPVYQSLISQDIAGWTISGLEQSYGDSSFRQGDSSLDGRVWFLTERHIAESYLTTAITGFTSNTLLAVGSSFTGGAGNAVKFTTAGSLPISSPQIELGTYYWVTGLPDQDHFKVFSNITDAEADVNEFTFTSAGTASNVVAWPRTPRFFIEELTFDTFLDCAEYYNGVATDTITGLSRFNAQDVKMVGDGFGFEAQGNNNEVIFEAHGETVEVELAYVGFPIRTVIETLPLSIPQGAQSTLTRPTHIRNVNFIFNNTIGGYVDDIPIAISSLLSVQPGSPPIPRRGIFPMSIMKGWDDFNNPAFTIEHDDPFDIQLLGVFYTVDVYT